MSDIPSIMKLSKYTKILMTPQCCTIALLSEVYQVASYFFDNYFTTIATSNRTVRFTHSFITLKLLVFPIFSNRNFKPHQRLAS